MSSEQPIYQHTQNGKIIWAVICLALIIVLVALLITMSQLKDAGAIYPSDQTILLRLSGLMFVFLAVLLLFFRLTISVDRHYVRAIFGIGIIGKRIPLGDIAAVQAVTNPWYWGWGVRLIPGGWMWNISGLKAVELKLKNGRKYRLGTDEPEVLESMIKTRIVS